MSLTNTQLCELQLTEKSIHTCTNFLHGYLVPILQRRFVEMRRVRTTAQGDAAKVQIVYMRTHTAQSHILFVTKSLGLYHSRGFSWKFPQAKVSPPPLAPQPIKGEGVGGTSTAPSCTHGQHTTSAWVASHTCIITCSTCRALVRNCSE